MFLSRHLSPWRRRRARQLIDKADRARDVGNYAAAAGLYRRALAFDPRRTDIRVQLGHLLKLLGRTKEAIAAYSAAHQLLPGNEAPAIELRALGAAIGAGASGADTVASEARIRDADRLRDARRYAEAADAYGQALRLSPTRSDIRIQQGNMLKDAGRLAQAEAAYRCALTQPPEDAEVHLQLGHVLKLQGRRTEALLAYRRAIEIRPSLEPAWNELFPAVSLQSHQESSEAQGRRGGVEALLAMTEEVV